jgi:hypothetical protein
MKEQGFALLPDDGRPPRLIRRTTLTGGLVATLDFPKNILRVDAEYYDQLDAHDKWTVDTTQVDLYACERGGRISVTRTHG